MLTIKKSFNDRTYEIWVNDMLVMQHHKLEYAMELGMYYVEKYGMELHLDI